MDRESQPARERSLVLPGGRKTQFVDNMMGDFQPHQNERHQPVRSHTEPASVRRHRTPLRLPASPLGCGNEDSPQSPTNLRLGHPQRLTVVSEIRRRPPAPQGAAGTSRPSLQKGGPLSYESTHRRTAISRRPLGDHPLRTRQQRPHDTALPHLGSPDHLDHPDHLHCSSRELRPVASLERSIRGSPGCRQ